jgi:prevent-host-death family protein
MDVDHGIVDWSMDSVNISTFKATCLERLDRVKRTGRPLLVTRKGEPIAEIVPPSPPTHRGSWLGTLSTTGRIVGDIVSPASTEREWDVLRK